MKCTRGPVLASPRSRSCGKNLDVGRVWSQEALAGVQRLQGGEDKAVPRSALRSGDQETRIWGNSGKLGRMRLNVVSLRGEGFTCPLAATHAVGNCFRSIRSEQGWSRLTAGVSAAVQADQAGSRQRACLLRRRQ